MWRLALGGEAALLLFIGLISLDDAGDHWMADYVIGLEETRHQIALIEAQTGILVGAHDLRRTWASLADKCGVGGYAIKAALNHATTNDVTGTHYAQVDVDDLRQPMQKVENYILAKLAAAKGENVIPLHPAREVAA